MAQTLLPPRSAKTKLEGQEEWSRLSPPLDVTREQKSFAKDGDCIRNNETVVAAVVVAGLLFEGTVR